MTKTVFNFTKAALEGLPIPADGKRLVVRDTKVPGLQLRVTSNGVKTFSVRRRVKGGSDERITLKRFPDMSIERAQAAARDYISQLADGKSVADVKRTEKGEHTFGSFFTKVYVPWKRDIKKARTWKEDETKYEQHLKRPLGGKKLSTITKRDVASIHAQITFEGHPIAANRVVALLSSVFSVAIKADHLKENPAKEIDRNKEKSRDRFIQRDELPRFFESVAAELNETIRDYILLSLFTGARRANVLAMHSRELDLDDGRWRIPRTKNNDPQTVALVPEAVAIIRSKTLPPGGGYIFPGPGESGHLEEPRKGWLRVLERAGALGFVRAVAAAEQWSSDTLAEAESTALADPVAAIDANTRAGKQHGLHAVDFALTDLRIHDLRRTLGSWQAKTGASLSIIGKSLNHRNMTTTMIYARLDHDPVAESVGRATAAMLEAGGVKPSARVIPLTKQA